MLCAEPAMTRAWIDSGGGTASARSRFAAGCTMQVAHGPRRTGVGSMSRTEPSTFVRRSTAATR